MWFALRALEADPRQAGVIAATAGLGILLNFLGLAGRGAVLSGWLRILALTVTLLISATAVLTWSWITFGTLPEVPPEDAALRGALTNAGVMRLWLAVALGYVALMLVLLPSRPPTAAAAPI